LKEGISFKAILYRQKQLNSFIISYANLIRHLPEVTEQQIQHLYAICIIAVRQHYNYFEKYKAWLYDSLVNMVISF
jgi:DNA-dependent protein kinase catalytic subunit